MIAEILASAMILLPQVPDAKLTPGAINTEVSITDICKPGYTAGLDAHGKPVRNVSESTKQEVFKRYKIDPKSGHFEVDHLISLELGGSNDIENLWPQSYDTKPYNAHLKDQLENKLHYMVCHDQITLKDAQIKISKDWIAAFKTYVSKDK